MIEESKAARELREALEGHDVDPLCRSSIEPIKKRVESVLAELAAVTAERNSALLVKELLEADHDKAQSARNGPSQFSGIVNLICTECGKNYVTHCNECARKDSVPVVELEPIIKLLKNMQAFMTMEVWESTLKEIARLEALKGGKA